jgi:perosamine synthetase
MATELAIDGGTPVRRSMLPYAHQTISSADVEAVVSVLKSPWLTTGPAVDAFESAFAARVHAKDAVAVSSGTAALHAAMHTLGLGEGDEVIVPALTFVASANAAVYIGARPIFADVDPDTLLLDVGSAERVVSARAKAVVTVDYAGQPCDCDLLRDFAEDRGLDLVIDACHSLGATWGGRPSSSFGRLAAFSFHPVKHITTGEGGMVAVDSPDDAARLRAFRNHGIDRDSRAREHAGSWQYAMTDLGYNYRLSDLQCALGLAQLARLDEWLERRRAIAALYLEGIASIPGVRPLAISPKAEHAWHLFVVQLELERLRVDKNSVFEALRAEGIGVNVHYMPVHLQPYYQRHYDTRAGMCPVAEAAYERILSLPMFAAMTDADVADVLTAVTKVLEAYRR